MKPLVIFEMANNHMGDLFHAKNIIDSYYRISLPYKKKIDFAFKFQFRDLKTYIHYSFEKKKHKQVKRFVSTKLSDEEWNFLINFCKKKFKIICTAFDENSVDLIIKKKFDYLKIASCSLDDWPLLEHIAKNNNKIPMIASLGGADENKIRNQISFFSNRKKKVNYLYCVAKYPTQPNDLNLAYFKFLKEQFGDKILGFSSHENPSEILSGSLAYAMGARIFEKHVDINSKKYSINKYSTTPNQLAKWLENLNLSIDRVGSIKNRNRFLVNEIKSLSAFKRGVYLKPGTKIKRGQQINLMNVEFAFPCSSDQITANDFSKFNIIVSKKNIVGGVKLCKKDVKISRERKEVEIIRDKILSLIYKLKIIISNNQRLEISHHNGIENYHKVGMSMITIYNSKYCKKLLFLFKNQYHPPQFHKKKQETFFVIHGLVNIKIVNKNNSKNLVLKVGDLITIFPGEIHSFKCISNDGCVIEELSTKSIKEDSYYLDKTISENKNRKSYISL